MTGSPLALALATLALAMGHALTMAVGCIISLVCLAVASSAAWLSLWRGDWRASGFGRVSLLGNLWGGGPMGVNWCVFWELVKGAVLGN